VRRAASPAPGTGIGEGPPVPTSPGATLGFEEHLWTAAERLRGHVEPAEYKHVLLGLIFLRYVTDPALASAGGSDLVVPEGASWTSLRSRLAGANPAEELADFIDAVERANPALAGIAAFDARRLGGARTAALIEALTSIPLGAADSRDVLGRVYEYFLAHFASAEGRSGGEYYTPPSVVELLVEMVCPQSGTVYDPCCGTAGMFVQSARLRRRRRMGESNGGSREDEGALSFFGQESSPRALQIARMNLALRGVRADLGGGPADTFTDDRHATLKADFVLANPPFNARAWGFEALADDARWRFGAPPRTSANYAWLQHIVSHLKPEGLAGVVLANGSLSSDQGGEASLRQRMVDAGVVECIVTLPAQLFYGTQIPACVWMMSPGPSDRGSPTRSRPSRTLFIDARARGRSVDRVHAELTADDIAAIAGTYRRWRRAPETFRTIPGFAKSASLDEVRSHRYALVPGRYVGFAREAGQSGAASDVEVEAVRRRLEEAHVASNRFCAAIEAMKRG
jgi:type I restriction enzyme M protein